MNNKNYETDVFLIRHGATSGNLKKAFVGITDESLCMEGINELQKIKSTFNKSSNNPCAFLCSYDGMIYVSPRKRCIETASLVCPNAQMVIIDDFAECDFGIMEGKNHEELLLDERYVAFINEENAKAFPEGEDIEAFLKRNAEAFSKIVKDIVRRDYDKTNPERIIIFAHGGTMMGILGNYYEKKEEVPYYKWTPSNGHGYHCRVSINDNDEIVLFDVCDI